MTEMFTRNHNSYSVEMSTWQGNGFPHPLTGKKQNPKSFRFVNAVKNALATEITEFNIRLFDGTTLLVFND